MNNVDSLFCFACEVVVCLPDPNKADNFQFLSECSVQSVTRLFVDNDVRNYCILVSLGVVITALLVLRSGTPYHTVFRPN